MAREQVHLPSTAPSELRIAISAKLTLVRAGVRCILEHFGHLRVCAETEDLAGVLPLVATERPDIALAVVGAPPAADLAALQRLRSEHPELGIVLVANAVDRMQVVEPMRLGVRAILTRDATPAELVEAVREAHAGRRYLHAAAAAILLDDLAGGADARSVAHDGLDHLSAREREVFDLLVLGRSSQEIASALGISQHTTDTHRRRAMTKLGLGSPVDVVKFAVRRGLISLDD